MNLVPKLENLVRRHAELATLLSAPDATDDMDRFTRLNKEYAELAPVVDAFGAYQKMLTEKQDLEEMLTDKTADAEMLELAEAELGELREQIPVAEQTLQLQLLPKDEVDERSIILEVRAGTGGDEAALFAGELYRMYCRYAEQHNWKVEELSRSDTPLGGLKEVVASIKGHSVYAHLKFESGVHRVQRVPATETQGRIHTSACTVAVLPEAEEVDVNIEPKDLRIDVFRSSGPGGQSVNTTDSAVRVTHLPTGVVVSCQDEKSQHKNKEKALKILRARVLDAERERAAKERADARKSQIGSGDRSERIRTYNFPQGRVTDHRINVTLYNLLTFMGGDLDEMLNALTTADQAQRLEALADGDS